MALPENKQPLLKKVYFDGCPGCKVEQRKDTDPRMPYKEFFYVFIITICTTNRLSLKPHSLSIGISMATMENKESLLKKVYFDGCPGCKLDKRKDTNPRMPYKEFFYVFIVTLCTTLPITSVFPFVYFMIKDLHIAKREEDIGFYAGFVGSSFLFGRASTSLFWGLAADRYGRKPVIVIGTVSVIVFNTLFGVSTSFWMAITTRLFLGFLNGSLGPIKAYASEVSRPEHQAIGLSFVSVAWSTGLIVGPAIGGFFAQPAEKYPNIFSKESFFARFPYFLPCFCISLLAIFVLISCFWLPETLHTHCENKISDGTTKDLEAPAYESELIKSNEEIEEKDSTSKKNLLKNWPLMSSIIVYCIFCLQDMAYTEIFSLWAESDRKYGGLNFSTQDVGEVLAISGLSLLLYQLLFYPTVEKLFGPITSSRGAAILIIPLLATFPLMGKLSGTSLFLVVLCGSFLRSVLNVTIMTGFFILQNNAVSQEQRGAANGISTTLQSLMSTFAPAGGGALISWAQKRQYASFLPGSQMVFFVLCAVEFIGFLLTFKPFLRPSGI